MSLEMPLTVFFSASYPTALHSATAHPCIPDPNANPSIRPSTAHLALRCLTPTIILVPTPVIHLRNPTALYAPPPWCPRVLSAGVAASAHISTSRPARSVGPSVWSIWSVGWLGWLVDRLLGGLVGWSASWSVGCSVDWLASRWGG